MTRRSLRGLFCAFPGLFVCGLLRGFFCGNHVGYVDGCGLFTAESPSPVGASGWRVGIPVAKTKANKAAIASTAREAFSPVSRACSFSAMIASAVAAGTPASWSAVRRSWSEMNGMPLASSTCAFDETCSGMAGLPWMPVKKDEVSAEIRTAPASAVPMEAPGW